MSGIDPLAVATKAPALAGGDAVFIVAIAADPAVIEALLAEKLLDAIVTAVPQPGTVAAETPRGPVSLATPQALPPATALLLRPAAVPGRAIVTVLPPPRRAAPQPASAPVPTVVVVLDDRPVVAARILGASLRGQPPALPPGTVVALRIIAVTPPPAPAAEPADAAANGALPEPAGPATARPIERAAAQPAQKVAPTPPALPPTGSDADAAPMPSRSARAPATHDLPAEASGPAAAPRGMREREEAAGPAGARRSTAPQTSRAPTADPASPRVARADRPTAETTRTGTVVATTASETIVDTEMGRLAVPTALDAPRGSVLVFTVAREPGAAPLPASLNPPATATERAARQLEQALGTARAVAPEIVSRLAQALQPDAPERIVAALVNFVAAARGRALDPIAAVAHEVAGSAHSEAAAALQDAGAALAEARQQESSAAFQPVAVPLVDAATVQMLTVYLPRERDSGGGDAGEGDASRFAVEVELSRLGPLQLDGLVRPKRLDLVLRSRRPLPIELRQELATAFKDSLAASGFAGEIAFAVVARFPIGGGRRPQPLSIST
jgi:hypothetical protein